MEKYKHIIWDWNGTLFDDAKLCYDIINRIVIDNNLPAITFEKYLEVFTFPVKDYYAAVGLPTENGEFERLGKIFIDEYERRKFEADLRPCTKSVLSEINNCGVRQSALSAYSYDKLEAILSHFGLSGFFEKIAGLDNIYAHGKVEIGKKLVKELNLAKGEALLIGDTLHDAEVAREIGADVLLIAGGHQSVKRLKNSGHVTLNSLNEVTNFLCRVNEQ